MGKAVSPGALWQAWIIFSALCISILLLAGVGYFITQQDPSSVSPDALVIPPLAFLGIGLVFVAVGGGIRATLLAPTRLDEQLQTLGTDTHQKVMSFNIITWGLTESLAVFGFVATLFTGDVTWVGAGSGTAFVAMLLWHRPRFPRTA